MSLSPVKNQANPEGKGLHHTQRQREHPLGRKYAALPPQAVVQAVIMLPTSAKPCTFSSVPSRCHACRSIAALPAGTIFVILLSWTIVTVPLTVFMGITGKNAAGEFYAPCRTNKYPREVPDLPWYRSAPAQMALAGFLPFSAIYVELYYVFASVWGHKVFIIWSILVIVVSILVVTVAFITVALVYFQLAVEDHRWWWRSFMCGGATGIWVYAYCVYYYFFRSGMTGLLQTSFFFGYMAVACYGLFIMLGTVGFRASLAFVRRIYYTIKAE